ncbi:hypothetical protein BT63DRAFT_423698 [Microthyrium microscopicum]|uniref:DNA mismatch repair protein MSH3 n=1 Tax=Microthyrium microscopicum TaxID=703497 RepID=A0A6A6UGU8_9PEZI|nr:hypothetical protein BT63DRAFT_423698 [Microthyrium microscopicum]
MAPKSLKGSSQNSSNQRSISSFFTPKPSQPKPPAPQDASVNMTNTLTIASIHKKSTKRQSEDITSDVENELRNKKRKTDVVAASRFVYSSTPTAARTGAEALDLTEEDEETKEKKMKLHEQFVEKLTRPREDWRRQTTEHEEEEAQDMEEEEEPLPKSRKGKKNSLTPMVQQYLDVKRQNLDKIIVFEVGYKFQFYGEDARVAAKELNIVCIPGVMTYDNDPQGRLASASIPVGRLPVHVKRLVAAGHKVGVVKQLETAALKAVGDNRGGPFVRKLTNVYTQGTYIEDPEAEEDGPGTIICLTETILSNRVHVGMVSVQPTTGYIMYDDFDDEFMRSELETRLLHLTPCEYLIVGSLSDETRKIVKHLSGSSRSGVKARVENVTKSKTMVAESFSHVSSFYASKFQQSENEEPNTARQYTLDQIHQLSEQVTMCLSAMIKHLTEYGLQHVFDLTVNFQNFSTRNHMMLNGNTLNSLEIYHNQTDHGAKGSLFWQLDRTKTRFGKRLLRKWIGRPLLDQASLEARINAVQELKDSGGSRENDRLRRVLKAASKSDLEKILIRIYYKRATRKEVLLLLRTLQAIGNEFAGSSYEGFRSDTVNNAGSSIAQITTCVTEFLDRVRWRSENEEDLYSFFREDFESEAVTDQKCLIAEVEHDLEQHRAEAASKLGRPVNFVTISGIEYLVEVENSKAQLGKVPASWLKVSGTKKSSRFHTPEVVKSIRRRDQYKESLAEACDIAFTRYLEQIGEYYRQFRDCIFGIATLDCLFSLAEIANQPGYCKPDFSTGDPHIEIKQGRHPMVEQLLLDNYVPNDIDIGPSGTTNALLITGPNMGGKSSYVRSMSLICIMAQIGSFVPADSARLSLLDGVYTRMGALDNIMKGESTFMVELGETSQILKQATRRSLVILDELGRGTSTMDGVAIAEAVLQFLIDRGIMTLFITHYQDLAKVALGNKSLKNVHVKFRETDQDNAITFLYQISGGVAHRSYGLHVARLANIPRSIIELAAVKSRELEMKISHRRATNLGKLVTQFLRGESTAVERLLCASTEAG